MNRDLKLVRDGDSTALYVPDGMQGGALHNWIISNEKTLAKSKEKLLNSKKLTEILLYTIPTKTVSIPMGEHDSYDQQLFEKRVKNEKSNVLIFTDGKDDHKDWMSGYVEYLIDRYMYTTLGPTVIVNLNERKN